MSPQIIWDEEGHPIVLLPEIIFKNRKGIQWEKVEDYLLRYVGTLAEIVATGDLIYIGSDFQIEYGRSVYTRALKGARAKAKANAVQGIVEMLEIANDRKWKEDFKQKHGKQAQNGWYYYTTRFAIPIFNNENKTEELNVYTARIIVNHAKDGNLYLYDFVDIKKEASNPLKNTK